MALTKATVLFFLAALLVAQTPAPAKLWAGISVPEPVFSAANVARLQIFFAVVNDGSVPVNPDVEASHLLINGAEPKDWRFIIGNGLRTEYFRSLPPNHTLGFSYQLGRLFVKPGIYSVRWESANFKSADLVFRVVPIN